MWDHLPRSVQQQIIDKKLKFFVIDASRVAQEVGLKNRANTVLQTCFFALSGVLPRDQAIAQIKHSIRKTYGGQGRGGGAAEFQGRGCYACPSCMRSEVPAEASSTFERPPAVPATAPEFVQQVTARMFEGLGDQIPVSLMPVDGTWPSGTAAWEKRNIAEEVPVWRPDLCVQCGQCSFVCPHSVIRAKYFDQARLDGAPAAFQSAPVNARGYPDVNFSLQFYVEDCTGMRPMRGELSGRERRRARHQGDQHGAEGAPGGPGAREYRILSSAFR